MEQTLYYRAVRYVVGHQVGAVREWTIYPDGEARVQKGQTITAQGMGSFKAAVRAAQAAIDVWLDSNGVAKLDGAGLTADPVPPSSSTTVAGRLTNGSTFPDCIGIGDQ